jgi:two-component system OmpR family sensor kinase
MNLPPAPQAHERLRAMPLRWRLIAVVVVLMLAAIVLTSGATTALLRGYLMDRTDKELRQAAVPVASAAFAQVLNQRSDLDPFAPPNTYAVRIMPTGSGKPIDLTTPTSDQDHPKIPDLSLADSRVRSGQPFTVGSVDGDGRWRVVAGATRDGTATFAVAVSLATVDSTVHRLRVLTTIIGLVVTAACAVIGWFAVRRAFRPLREIEDTAAAIAGGDLTRRIPQRTAPDEVTSLADSLNAMLAQIEQSFAVREASEDRMRRFVGDASHELRTPLATVRGYAELFRQGAVREPEEVAGAMRRIEDEASRMGGLVEDLLLLTRLDTPRSVELGTVDLTVLAADAAQDAKALDPGRSIRLLPIGALVEPTLVAGDEERLRQVVANLVANAINHTPAGSPIELAVGRRDSRAVLEVRDHGSGVAPEDAARVFERFYRADPARTRGHGGGNGLGLAIVAAIVSSHHGRVGLAPTPGAGATFVVELPTASSQDSPSPSGD